MAGLTFFFQASGTNPNALINAVPSAGPQSSPAPSDGQVQFKHVSPECLVSKGVISCQRYDRIVSATDSYLLSRNGAQSPKPVQSHQYLLQNPSERRFDWRANRAGLQSSNLLAFLESAGL